MILSNFDEQLFQSHVLKKLGKFSFALLEKLPFLTNQNLPVEDVFRLFYLHGSNFNIYFYIDLVKYLDKFRYSFSILEQVMEYAAITSLFNKNAIYYLRDDGKIRGCIRLDNQVLKFEVDSLEDIRENWGCLLALSCNCEGEKNV